MKLKILTTLLLVALLTGCAATQPEPNSGPIQPPGTHLTPQQQFERYWKSPQPQAGGETTSQSQVPYWENSQWLDSMGQAIKDHVHYPINLGTTSILAGSGVVQFTYAAGTVQDVGIVSSTGSPVLDRAITDQVSRITLPTARGASADIPHRFEITVHMVPPEIAAFYRSIWQDVQDHVQYPRQAVLSQVHGIVFARFKYHNGVISDPEVYKTSGSPILDRYVIDELSNLKAPPAPSWVGNRALQLSVPVSFCLEGLPCATLEYRYVAAKTTSAAVPVCAHVKFKYTDSKISNVQLASSSGVPKLDKVALAQIAKGDFPITPQMAQAPTTHFEIPVCYQPRQNAPPPGTVNPPAHASRLGTMDQALRWHGTHAVAERGQAV